MNGSVRAVCGAAVSIAQMKFSKEMLGRFLGKGRDSYG